MDPVLPTLKLAVVKEGAKELAGDHREQLDKVLVESRFKKKHIGGFKQSYRLGKLKGVRELARELPHTVDKLREHGRSLLVRGRDHVGVAVAVVELVAKREPLFFDQDAETSHGTVVRVHHQLRQRRQLCCAVPSIALIFFYYLCK